MKKDTRFKKGHKINLGRKLSLETRNKLSKIRAGNLHVGNFKAGHKINKGRKLTIEHKNKLFLGHKLKMTGKNNPRWKGGITPENRKIRSSKEYRIWRCSVFTRDNYTCIWCGQIGGRLNADHIKPFAQFPELRFAIDNGRTLCVECHKKTDTYGEKTK